MFDRSNTLARTVHLATVRAETLLENAKCVASHASMRGFGAGEEAS